MNENNFEQLICSKAFAETILNLSHEEAAEIITEKATFIVPVPKSPTDAQQIRKIKNLESNPTAVSLKNSFVECLGEMSTLERLFFGAQKDFMDTYSLSPDSKLGNAEDPKFRAYTMQPDNGEQNLGLSWQDSDGANRPETTFLESDRINLNSSRFAGYMQEFSTSLFVLDPTVCPLSTILPEEQALALLEDGMENRDSMRYTMNQ